jgi:hypothetical protein
LKLKNSLGIEVTGKGRRQEGSESKFARKEEDGRGEITMGPASNGFWTYPAQGLADPTREWRK